MLVDRELINKVEKITGIDYQGYAIRDKKVFEGYQIESMLEDLLCEIDNLQEKLDDLEQDLEDNYKPISKAKQFEISDCDFI